eukprot:TRINITY_DN794_c0_g2_i1.p1 TRINITY_DN794_c0_g2~~TRINITY_DN794_c0_g2_i1.p1  ORF type:complete len:277 (-),score=13.74 TRINITY_DN794_c0_g2_i1:192-986(-)
MAAQQASRGQVAAAQRAVAFQRLDRVDGAGGREAAATAEPGTEEQAIALHRPDQKPLRQAAQPGRRTRRGPHRRAPDAAARNSVASSPCTAVRSAFDAALGNWATGNGLRRRSTQSPERNPAAPRWKALRPCRLIRLRVTARRAWRLGITRPKRSGSSTSPSGTLLSGVDNSPAAPSFVADRWCSTKCSVRAQGRWASTRSKSAARNPAGAVVRLTPRERKRLDQRPRRLRPLARRAFSTRRPPRVFMRTRKPWVRARRVFEGW